MGERASRGAVLFDLDGTFADTAPDMGRALNRLLADHGRPALTAAAIRPHVSNGARAMIRLGFGLLPGDDGFDALRAAFLDRYASAICLGTRPFPGIPELLARLERYGLPWGIVTNKPGWLTGPLLARMTPEHRLCERAACIVSGDTAPRPKPHPDPLLHACAQIGCDPAASWYIGDDPRDIQAGRAAGMRTLTAGWGYLGVGDAPVTWGADGLIDHPLEVVDWVCSPTPSAPVGAASDD
jgi:2-phosphoglycolate phosphatase